MSTVLLLLAPLVGLIIICSNLQYSDNISLNNINISYFKSIGQKTSNLTLLISIYIFIMFHFSSNHFQFVQNPSNINSFNMSFGVDGSSIYFVLLTTIIMPIALLSNWRSITSKIKPFLSIILLLETLLLSIFLVLDGFLFYVFFESILPPLFISIGLFGSADRVKAAFYLFLYTLLGSLFMLLSILRISSLAGYVQYGAVYKSNLIYGLQLFLFAGIFIAFAVKTPTIFLNNWLLKAHVESPLSGSIILAGIVLKLSLYGIFRLMLPLLAKACIVGTKLVYVIGFITIIYGSASTIRTIDIKELIAYSSVCHAAVYLTGVFSNVVTGIEGGILLGLGHGFVSSGLFICVGGVLYDRSSTRLISVYRGMAQLMPLFSILLFILCLGNCSAPLTFNFIGEFMSLYGVFERHVIFAPLASLSIIFSAAYTIYLFNRIAFAGSYSKYFNVNISDLDKREFYMLLTLVIFTVTFGIYPAPILDGIHYSTTTLLYSTSNSLSLLILSFMFCKPPKPHASVTLSVQSRFSVSAFKAAISENLTFKKILIMLVSLSVGWYCKNVIIDSYDLDLNNFTQYLFATSLAAYIRIIISALLQSFEWDNKTIMLMGQPDQSSGIIKCVNKWSDIQALTLQDSDKGKGKAQEGQVQQPPQGGSNSPRSSFSSESTSFSTSSSSSSDNINRDNLPSKTPVTDAIDKYNLRSKFSNDNSSFSNKVKNNPSFGKNLAFDLNFIPKFGGLYGRHQQFYLERRSEKAFLKLQNGLDEKRYIKKIVKEYLKFSGNNTILSKIIGEVHGNGPFNDQNFLGRADKYEEIEHLLTKEFDPRVKRVCEKLFTNLVRLNRSNTPELEFKVSSGHTIGFEVIVNDTCKYHKACEYTFAELSDLRKLYIDALGENIGRAKFTEQYLEARKKWASNAYIMSLDTMLDIGNDIKSYGPPKD